MDSPNLQGWNLDWFLPAIESQGDVKESLAEVIRAEQYKIAFITVVQTNLCAYKGKSSDSFTELRRRVRKLENTLNFRIGMLAPERRGAWFRESLKQKPGPFPAHILSEPVFAPFETVQTEELRDLIAASWRERRLKPLPFTENAPCLWMEILELNKAYEEICRLGKPFQDFRLDELPAGLPPRLYTPSLQAFLEKVQEVAKVAREELDRNYQTIWQASSRFWDYQLKQVKRDERKEQHQFHKTAEELRGQFRERRSAVRKQMFYTSADMQALKYLGFEEMPDKELLRRRFHELARKFHPDRQGGDENKFKALNKAYRHLITRLEKLSIKDTAPEMS